MGGITALLVDDDPDIRQIVTIALQLDPDIRVVAVESGAAARGKLRGGLRPDLLLIDARLRKRDGVDVLQAIRSDGYAAVPAVFLSAATDAADRERYEAAGAIGLIEKPFDPIHLAERVRAFLRAV